MGTRTYEALLARPDTVQRVRSLQRAVEQIGGKLEVGPSRPGGMTLVRLTLPEPYTPNDLFPGIPFFPV